MGKSGLADLERSLGFHRPNTDRISLEDWSGTAVDQAYSPTAPTPRRRSIVDSPAGVRPSTSSAREPHDRLRRQRP